MKNVIDIKAVADIIVKINAANGEILPDGISRFSVRGFFLSM